MMQPADDHGRARGDRRPGVRHDRGVLRRDLDLAVLDPERIGHELREDRLGALAHLGAGGQDPDAAVVGQLEAGDRCQLDLAGAGEPGTVPGQRQADAGGDARAVGPALAHGARLRVRPVEGRCLRGGLEDVDPADRLAQDLAGRRGVALAVDPAPAQVER